MTVPDLPKLATMSLQELRNLTITKVEWNDNLQSFRLTLNDGQSVEALYEKEIGSLCGEIYSHNFDPSKKITRVETKFDQKKQIFQLNFYHNEERLVLVGWTDKTIRDWPKILQKKVFSIAEDEQLIGCELVHSN